MRYKSDARARFDAVLSRVPVIPYDVQRALCYGALGLAALLLLRCPVTEAREDGRREVQEKIAVKAVLAARHRADSLRKVVKRDTLRLAATRDETDAALDSATVVMPPPDVPVVPRDVVDDRLAKERAACDAALKSALAIAFANDSLAEQERRLGSLRTDMAAPKRFVRTVTPLYEPLVGVPSLRVGARARLWRGTNVIAEGEQRFAPGEKPRLLVGALLEF